MKAMRTYTILVEPEEGGGFYVTVPALPGCFTRGRTVEECRDRAVEAIEVHIAGLLADGEPVPEESDLPQLVAVTVAA
jgi:antitoxin HicB